MSGTFGAMIASLAANPRILLARPALNLFLAGYIRKFKPRRVGGHLILHSHLPPINSSAYSRFVDEHILKKCQGPSHAQIGITNACPQHCSYCYNRDRTGEPMSTSTILRTIGELQRMGVVWLGLTGGEPLLNPDIVQIVGKAAEKSAVKLFTTGCGLTASLASELKQAGLFSVSVSLDDLDPETHDRGRGCPGAYSEALRAIEVFKGQGIDTGVSSVLSGETLRPEGCRRFLSFLGTLGINEAWISEVKPSGRESWNRGDVCTESDREALSALQDRLNRRGGMTVNYLGHFEGAAHFGCNAGTKMIYVDAFGEVSPCVFTPLSFGNVRASSVSGIWNEMSLLFSHSSSCFACENHHLYSRYDTGSLPVSPEGSRALVREAVFRRPARFQVLLNGRERSSR